MAEELIKKKVIHLIKGNNRMNKTNMVLAIISCVVGILILILIPFQVSAVSSNDRTLGADFFPKLIGVLMIVASVGLFAESFYAYKLGIGSEAETGIQWKREKKVLTIFLLLVVYVLALQFVGFLVGSILFGTAMMIILGVRTWWYFVIFIVSVFIVYYVFHYLLYVHLPAFKLFK